MKGDLVLDNCIGSGTTAIACIKEKRHFIGYEITKEYFDIAQERIKQEQSQITLFQLWKPTLFDSGYMNIDWGSITSVFWYGWGSFVLCHDVRRWAYIDDFIHKTMI